MCIKVVTNVKALNHFTVRRIEEETMNSDRRDYTHKISSYSVSSWFLVEKLARLLERKRTFERFSFWIIFRSVVSDIPPWQTNTLWSMIVATGSQPKTSAISRRIFFDSSCWKSNGKKAKKSVLVGFFWKTLKTINCIGALTTDYLDIVY